MVVYLIGIIKGDVRYTYLSQLLENSILSNELKDFYDIDRLVLPFKGINNEMLIYGTNINILDILQNNRINVIYTGNANVKLKKLCDKNGITLYEMLNDLHFTQENAFLTAKGILYLLHRDFKDISDENILILGYGNIAFYLAKLLKAFNTDFKIYPNNEIEKKYITLEGYKLLPDLTKLNNIIINTIPSNLDIDYKNLKNCRVIDVASAPYGFDAIKIEQDNINYEIWAAIPSKFAPVSAAEIIKKYMLSHQ